MAHEKLNDLLFHLNTLSKSERADLKKHFLDYSINCHGCTDCEVKMHIIEIYDLNQLHEQNKRRGDLYERASQFVKYHYVSDNK